MGPVSSLCRVETDTVPLSFMGKSPVHFYLMISDRQDGWKIGPTSVWILQTGSNRMVADVSGHVTADIRRSIGETRGSDQVRLKN